MVAQSAHDDASEGEGEQPASRPKTAILVIHGMGEQSPMETLRSFVEAAWTSAPWQARSNDPQTWSKRDFVSHSFETRRITTNADRNGKRVDFYELYWAHLMEGTRFSQVLAWIRRLLLRGSDRVPPAVMAPWRAGWIVAAVITALLVGVEFLRQGIAPNWPVPFYLAVVALVAAAWSYIRRRALTEVLGDAARYLTPAPPNIAARSDIRRAGVELLQELTRREDYDRIVVVCHSLGAVVGYDILSLFWGNINRNIKQKNPQDDAALSAMESASAKLRANPDDPENIHAYRDAQRGYFERIKSVAKGEWKVSDFVTLGAPLAHAHFLMVDDGQTLMKSEEEAIATERMKRLWRLDPVTATVAKMFRARAAQRELPLCPPLPESDDSFVYDPKIGDGHVPHHAALFAPVRWTNIYAPRRNLLWGDVISGPVAPLFGPGVKDVALSGDAAKSFIAHTKYWRPGYGDHEHLEALRAAVNLLDEPDAEAWERHGKEVKRLKASELDG